MAKGWRNEWERHAMARYGIKTGSKSIPELKLRSNRLPVQLGIVVPSTKFDKAISKKQFKKRVADEKKYFAELFGGETAIAEKGGYVTKVGRKKKLIEEEGIIVEASTTTDKYEKHKQKIANHVKNRRKDWEQETIGYTLEGSMFIYPKKSFIDSDKTKNVTLE